MSYLQAAFGGFEPRRDVDAAVKLSINAILMDSRLEDLANVLTDDHEVGGIEGDPGWIIERRDLTSPTHASFYSTWPAWAVFRAYVDISIYELAYPEFFMDRSTFYRYARAGLNEYLQKKSNEADLVSKVLSRMNAESHMAR